MNVQTESLGKQFGIKNISMHVASGQLVACVGTNGAGKSTLLRCLAALYQPTTGRILFDDQPFDRRKYDLRKRLHYIADTPPGDEHQSVIDHVSEYFAAYDHSSDGAMPRVLELLSDFNLSERVYYPLGRLSRGQRYKLAMVIQIALDRELWLTDEPFASGIDAIGMDRYRTHVREACGRGRTVIYTTQILEIAEAFSDQVCILHNGELVQCVPSNELRGLAHQRPGLLKILEELE